MYFTALFHESLSFLQITTFFHILWSEIRFLNKNDWPKMVGLHHISTYNIYQSS